MITIKDTSREFTKVEQYLMTLNDDVVSCKDIPDGTEIEIDGFLSYTDEKDDGKSVDVFAMIATDGKCYACTSATFERKVREIADIFSGERFTIIKKSGVTKSGKDYITASLKY